MHKVIAVCMLLMSVSELRGQADTSMRLEDVEVSASRFTRFGSGIKVQAMDSFVMLEGRYISLGDLLGAQSQVFIKSYGSGSIATTSFRGAGAAHTAVLWNGINLQSPMHGEFDFSMMPAYLVDEVSIRYGGNGALFGSGAIGGAIHADNNPASMQGLTTGAMIQAGSFGHSAYGLKLGYGGKQYSGMTKLFAQHAANDFTYRNTALFGSPEVRQQHASAGQQAVLTSHRFQLSASDALNVHGWFQDASRDIPPGMTRPAGTAFQDDRGIRGIVEWKHSRTRASYAIRQAVLDELIRYEDPDAYLVGRSHSLSSVSEGEGRWSLGRVWQLHAGLNHTWAQADADGYRGYVTMNRTSLFYAVKVSGLVKNLNVTGSMRHELVDGHFVPASPSLGFDWLLLKWMRLSGTASASYRVPTFNNRYWTPGGNPDLLPERGTGQELSLRVFPAFGRVKVDLTATGFSRYVSNWIIWLPKDGYWSPQNLQAVWSRGAEGTAKLPVQKGKWSAYACSQVSYVLSSNEQTRVANDASLGKQLIYTPRITHQHEVRVGYSYFFIAYNHAYTGVRFTASDHSEWLDPYQLGTVLAGASATIRGVETTLHAKAANVWNESYQPVLWRPAPPVNYMLTLIINLHIKNKTNP